MLGAMSIAAAAPGALNGETDTTADRVVRYLRYFTILSNIAVCVVSAMLAARPDRDGPIFGVARLDAVICITVTGLVHYTLLRVAVLFLVCGFVAMRADRCLSATPRLMEG
jgi:hypothetical protein